MDTRILEIVFYLMDYMQESDDQLSLLPEYSSDLKSLGYSDDEISTAYNWILDNLSASGENLFSRFPSDQQSSRILTDIERVRISPEAQALLIRLSNVGLMNREQQERILDRLSFLGPRAVSVEQVRLIASAILFDEYGEMEDPLHEEISDNSSYHIN